MANLLPATAGPIGLFDSGLGGLSVLRAIRNLLPEQDYLFLGDNARAPYGTRSFDVVYRYTLDGVQALFERGCHLVILACNTASAKALRTIQRHDLPQFDANRRVLGIIRPTAEVLGHMTRTRHVGLLATPGTVASESYAMEVGKLWPDITLTAQACPMWVPLVENHEYDKPGADYFVHLYTDQLLQRDPDIDLIVLGCTHFPFLYPKLRAFIPNHVQIVSQGDYVAQSLKTYLERHPEIAAKCTTSGTCRYLTTEHPDRFNTTARRFMDEPVFCEQIIL